MREKSEKPAGVSRETPGRGRGEKGGGAGERGGVVGQEREKKEARRAQRRGEPIREAKTDFILLPRFLVSADPPVSV